MRSSAQRSLCSCAGLLVALAACTQAPRPALEYGASVGSTAPELSEGADGDVYLSWVEAQGAGHALRYAVLSDAWSEPRTVATGERWFVNAADRPAVTALDGETLVAHWLRRTGEEPYAYGVDMAFSHDGGVTWGSAFALHDDGTQTEHGFVSTLARKAGLDVVWLDGRRFADDVEAARAMTLRHATLDTSGVKADEEEVDARICDCCATALAPVPGGLVVAYRDRTEREIRDVVVRRRDAQGWSEPVRVHDDDWVIDGCPVNGPALAAHGERVAVAWYTGAGDEPRVYVAYSHDAGHSFGAPVRVDAGQPAGRVAMVALDDGDVLVGWLERQHHALELRIRRVHPDGSAADAVRLLSMPATSRAFARIVRTGARVAVAWTEDSADASRVRAAVYGVDRF